jgi:hypothetical protein
MKVIIGLGDSWTQGEGGLPQEYFDKAGGNLINLDRDEDDPEILKHEHENSWVNQLTKKYFRDHKPINLGVRGYGNIGAVKNLYYSKLPKKITGGKLIFCLSGRDRFDYPSGLNNEGLRKFKTFYPQVSVPQFQWYCEEMWNENAANEWTLLSIIEAQNFARLHQLDFHFLYAFDNISDMEDYHNLSRHIDWYSCLTRDTTLLDLILEKDGLVGWDNQRLVDRPQPSKHFTNCLHPTIDGYTLIADYIYEHIKEPDPTPKPKPIIKSII